MRRNMTLVTAAMALAGFTAVASAQTLRVETVAVRPGQSATVKVYLQSPVNVSAVNFTVRASTTDVPGAITGVKGTAAAISGANYVFVPNNANVVSGGTREFRAVLYSSTSGQSFAATSDTHIATLTVPTSAASAPNLTITLEAPNTFVNGVTALVGVSDAQGRSIVNGTPIAAGSTARPTTVNGGVRLDPVITSVPFTGDDTLRSGWEFVQVIPDPNVSSRLTATVDPDTGVLISTGSTFADAFGLLQMADPGADWLNATADSVVVYNWDLTSDATVANELPSLRLRTQTRDFSWSQLSVVGEFFTRPNSLPEVLPVGDLADAPKSIRAASFAPASVSNGVGPNGMYMAFDILTFDIAAANKTLGIRNFSAYSKPVSSLTNQTVLYTGNFSGGSTDGFTNTINGFTDPALSDTANNVYRCTIDTSNGISLAPNSNQAVSQARQGTYYIAFATFERIFTAAELPVDTSRLYRLDFRARTTVANAQLAPTVRIRARVGQATPGFPNAQYPNGLPQPDFTQEIVIESVGQDSTQYLPTGAARTYTSYFAIPDDCDGGQVQLSLDVYPGGDWAQGAVVFEGVTVSSYDFPTP
ncbi:hypothetical protein GC173_08535 [bacterium]|nr:hypothetical protein [bacterium]